MGLLDNFKQFVHSITTEDHYASYDSPYKDSVVNNSSNVVGGRLSSATRLNELNNTSSTSLVGNGDGEGNKPAGFVGYRPGMRSSNTNLNGSDLQLQTLNRSGQPPLPSIDALWDRLEKWLDDEYPELYDSLNDGATTADLNEFEKDLGCGNLPVEFRQLYKRCDGQFRGGKPTGLFMGLVFLDLEGIVEEHIIWGKVADRLEKQQYNIQRQQQKNKNLPPVPSAGSSTEVNDADANIEAAKQKLSDLNINNSFIANQRSIPPNSIQPYYSHKGWVPICKDYFGNQIALDVAPGPAGIWGQIIIFGRDFDTKLVVASSLQEFLFIFISDLENGHYKVDLSEQDTSYGYLESSRNDDDYQIGDEDEDQGELNFYDKDNEFGRVGIPLTYFEVLKRRALKKYGITNVDKFLTSFVPQSANKRPYGNSSRLSSGQRSAAGSNVDLPKVSSPLINVESKVDLPKETIIDDKKEVKETVEPKVEEPKEPIEEPKVEESKVEEPKTEEPKVEESKVEEPKEPVDSAEEPKEAAEEPATEEPVETKDQDEELQTVAL